MSIRFDDDVSLMINNLKKEKNIKSTNKLVNQALRFFCENNGADNQEVFAKIKDDELDRILKKWEKSSYATQVRLNAREAAVDSQVLMEMMNSLIFCLEENFSRITTRGKLFRFYPILQKPHNISSNAKKAVNNKIAKAKQNRDFKKIRE